MTLKKLLLASLVLTIFTLSLLLFQITSCKKSEAQTTSVNVKQLNKIVYEYYDTPGAFTQDIYIANYDGTNQTKVNITLPSGFGIAGNAHLSPDGQKIFFGVGNKTTRQIDIYSCNIDGSSPQKVVDGTSHNSNGFYLGGAY